MSVSSTEREPRFCSTAAIAHRGSFHPDYLRQLRRVGGGPPYVRVGRAIRYDVAEFDAWMKSRTFRHLAEEAAGSRQPTTQGGS